MKNYILERENLVCLFVLLDSRHQPQKSDLAFMEFLGMNQIPLPGSLQKVINCQGFALKKSIHLYDYEMLKNWESLPPTFISSTVKKTGREEILNFIEESINNFSNPV